MISECATRGRRTRSQLSFFGWSCTLVRSKRAEHTIGDVVPERTRDDLLEDAPDFASIRATCQIIIDDWQPLSQQSEQSSILVGLHGNEHRMIAKCHHHRPNALREADAYALFAPVLSPWLAPFYGLIGGPRMFLLLGWVQHRQIQGAPNPEHHHTLGRFLRDLHSMPYTDTDGLSLSDAIALRWDRIIGAEQLEISDRLRDRLTQLLQGRDAGKRRWCHRDFDRRNWLWGDDYRSCTVIDFGQTRPDTRYVDWIHLMPQWSMDRDALDAFFDAYGGNPTIRIGVRLLGCTDFMAQ